MNYSKTECEKYIRIFEYFLYEYLFGHSFVSIFLIRIYSDIRSYHFLDTNIFGYSFVSKSYSVRVWRIFEYSNIRIIFNTNIHSYHIRIVSFYTNIFGYLFVSFSWYEYIRIFIRIEINTNVTLCIGPLRFNCTYKLEGGRMFFIRWPIHHNHIWHSGTSLARWVQLTAVSRVEEPVCVQPFRLQVRQISCHLSPDFSHPSPDLLSIFTRFQSPITRSLVTYHQISVTHHQFSCQFSPDFCQPSPEHSFFYQSGHTCLAAMWNLHQENT